MNFYCNTQSLLSSVLSIYKHTSREKNKDTNIVSRLGRKKMGEVGLSINQVKSLRMLVLLSEIKIYQIDHKI